MSEKPLGREVLSLMLGTIIGGIVTFSVQMLIQDHARAADLREARRAAATETFQEVGRLMDARYSLLSEALRAAQENRPIAPKLQLASDSIGGVWDQRIQMDIAVLCHYFGSSMAIQLVSISGQFEAVRSGSQQVTTEGLRRSIFELELRLADQLRRGDIFDGTISGKGCSGSLNPFEKSPDEPSPDRQPGRAPA